MFLASVRTATRIARRNGASYINSREPMTLDQIRKAAPSIFAESKHESRSDRYTYIPTSQIVEHLTANNYGVFAVNQSGSRDEAKRGFTKHLVRFRPLNQPLQVGGTYNEIVLVNSHDGSSAYRLTAGVLRLVCLNGLMVSEGTLEDIRIPHSGNVLLEVAEGVERLRGELPKIGQVVESMQALRLNRDEQRAFAGAALMLKYEEGTAPVNAERVLQPRREDDVEPTLWNTLNVVQEHLIRGGDHYQTETKAGRRQNRKTSAVGSVSGQTGLNRALWRLAEEMQKIKA